MTDGQVASRFRPGLWATLSTLAVLVVLLWLGTWQVQRLAWKEALIAEREAGLAAEPLALPAEIADPERLEHRRALLSGTFLHDRELRLVNRTRGGQVGVHLVTPLALEDGRVILVDRGWVPIDRRDPATRAAGNPAGPVALEVLLRRPEARRSVFQHENEPEAGIWFRVDPPAMAAAIGLPEVVPSLYAVALDTGRDGGLPKGAEARVEIRNDHLQYAVTWYALAGVLLTIYLVFGFKRGAGTA